MIIPSMEEPAMVYSFSFYFLFFSTKFSIGMNLHSDYRKTNIITSEHKKHKLSNPIVSR